MKLLPFRRPHYVTGGTVHCSQREDDVRIEECLRCEWLEHVDVDADGEPASIECDSAATSRRLLLIP